MTVSKKSYFIKESIVIKESGFVMTRIEKKEILSDEIGRASCRERV